MLSRWVIARLSAVQPEQRRLWAARVLLVSVAGWVASHVALQILGQGTFFTHMLNAISWWAVGLTAADIVSTNDVKVDTAEDNA